MAPSRERLGFIPNSQRVMARKPELLVAFNALGKAVNNQTDGSIPASLKYMIANAASLSAGCMYCVAHTGGGTARTGVDEQKIAAIWEFETSDLFSEAERSALRFAQAAAAVPNMATDEDFADLRKHFDEYQIVEIVAVISMFGFLSRWNDTMATAREEEPIEFAEKNLADKGWTGGKHVTGEAAESGRSSSPDPNLIR
ncbi:MAG: carboxymuconolactone decarboxylase family protein [Rhodospirillaceae bacterium]|nr:carboxymuconolactone decarboxylase family protein [Rhodospirillaceae bacterium]